MRKLFVVVILAYCASIVSAQVQTREVRNITSDPAPTSCTSSIVIYKNTVNATLWGRSSTTGLCVQLGSGAGDVSSAAVIADNAIVRGDGGAKGVQSSGIVISDSNGLNCSTDGGCNIGNGLADFQDLSLRRKITLRGATSGSVDIAATGTGGGLTVGSGPTTITDVAGGILPAALNAGIDAAKLADSSVSNSEFQFINTLTSNAQTQINAKQATLTDSAGLRGALSDENGTGVALFNLATLPDFTTGLRIGGTAASGNYLRGNGTNFVPAVIAEGDLPTGINAAKIGGGGVSTAEFDFLGTVTSNVQTQIDGKQSTLTNSAGLRAALSDEKGTGAALFDSADSPTFFTLTTARADNNNALSLPLKVSNNGAGANAGQGVGISFDAYSTSTELGRISAVIRNTSFAQTDLLFSTYDGNAGGLNQRMRIGYDGLITFNTTQYNTCSDLTTVGAVVTCTVSDERVKSGITPFSGDGLSTIRKIQPISFQFNKGTTWYKGGRTELGLSAQNLKDAHPLLASSTGNAEELLQPEPMALHAVEIDAIQRLDARVSALEKENKTLKTKLADPESKKP